MADFYVDRGGQMSGLAYSMNYCEDRMVRAYQLATGDQLHSHADLPFIITYIACSNPTQLVEKDPGGGEDTWSFTFPPGGHQLADLGGVHTGAGIRLKPERLLTTTNSVFVLGYLMPG